MKKTAKIICLILTLFVSALFSACKVNYNKLKISFCSSDGNSISQVRMIIDEEREESAKTKFAVQFDGIKQKNIGDVLIYSVPNDLVAIEETYLEDNKYFVNLQANIQGTGKIYAKHLTSGKTGAIDLVVDKKTKSLNKIVDEYIVAIPQTDSTQIFEFPFDELLGQDGTDKLGFRLASGQMPTGVELSFAGSSFDNAATGLQLSNNIEHNSSVTLYPVSFMQGYEAVTEYTTQAIKFTFVKALTNTSFVLDTDADHKQNGNLNLNNTVFHLIAKDTVQATGGNYQFNNIKFELKLNLGSDTELVSLINETQFGYLKDYYEIKWIVPEDFRNLLEVFEDEYTNIVIEAKDYAADIANIKIGLVPKCAGNLEEVFKQVQIKCDVKPTEFEISVQGKIQQNTGVKNVYNIDLYDYYNSADSALGASFTFKPLMEYSYADFKNIQIVVSPSILDVIRQENGKQIGTNTLNDIEGETLLDMASNRYLLQFYADGKPLEFDYSQQTGMAVSKQITYRDYLRRVQIKYTDMITEQDTKSLECKIQTCYSGDLEYLKKVGSTVATIQFNHKEGIKELTMYAGSLTKGSTGTDSVSTITDENNNRVKVENLYLDRNNSTINYVVYVNQILGDKNKVINRADINVKVIGGKNNPLKIVQNTTDATIGAGKTEIKYEYGNQSTNPPFNSIVLRLSFDENGKPITDVGNYSIVFTYADEEIYRINCLVYESLKSEQISLNVAGDSSLIANSSFDAAGQKTYKYAGYNADYIVKVDSQSKTTVTINLPEQFTNDYITGFTYNLVYCNNDNQIQEEVDINNYVLKLVANNKIELTFVKGTILEDKIGQIQLQIGIITQKFSNILQKGDTEINNNILKTFFAYEEITKDDISLTKTNVNGYWASMLSPYYKEGSENLSQMSVEVLLRDNTLWKYVQPQKQDEENSYNTIWFVNDNAEVVKKLEQTDNGIKLEFVGKQNSVSFDLFAQVQQFNLPALTLKCHVEVSEPVITDNVYITSETKVVSGSDSKRVISLTAGQEYLMEVEYYSNKFETLPVNERRITNPGIVMLVVDKFGNVHNSVVSVDGNKLIVRDNFTLSTDLSVIIFAKDALSEKLSYSQYDLSNLFKYLMKEHKTAYQIIDLVVSNGTEQNPYAIFNEKDFWQIGDSNLSKTKFYRLMNNIHVSSTKSIDGFEGGIDSYGSSLFTIYGLKLNNSVKNLFVGLKGKITNVNFEVNFGYINYQATNQEKEQNNLGLIDIVDEGATLANVCVTATTGNGLVINGLVSGGVKNYVYFGVLVGVNNGTIKYTKETIIGSNSSIAIRGNNLYFGGLVGLNNGEIVGKNDNNQTTASGGGQEIKFTSFVEDQGAVSSVSIVASGFEYGALGGVVGLNKGKISCVYATGTILTPAEKILNNVGGVIGENNQAEAKVQFELNGSEIEKITLTNEKTYLTKLKSSVQIKANNNVGGITGVDTFGIYSQCKYQIFAGSKFGIQANSNVGGIVGYANNTALEYCSTYSYRWDYSNLETIESQTTELADISADSAVSGLIGFANSTNDTIVAGVDLQNVVIKNSSVNAYVLGTTTAHALIGQRNDKPNAVLDCYFLGGIKTGEGNTAGFKGSNNGASENANVNYAYVIRSLVNETINIKNGTITNADGSVARTGWSKNENLNSNQPYVLQKNETIKPTFDVAPTSITLKLKDTAAKEFGVKDEESNYVNNLIRIDLLDYNLNSNDAIEYYTSQTKKNTHSIIADIFTIKAQPADLLSEVRLKVDSTNSSILMISNGNLIARSTGVAQINFTSVLNQNVKSKVNVDVSKPFGEKVQFYLSRDDETFYADSTGNSTISLTQGEAVLLNYIAIGGTAPDIGGGNYRYLTNEKVNLRVNVEVASGNLEDRKTISDYLLVSGFNLNKDNSDNYSIVLNYNTPFSIKAIRKIENVEFKFTVTPFINIGGGDNYQYTKNYDKPVVFNVETVSGVSAMALDSENIILYPNDTTTITAILTTDKELKTKEELSKLINYIKINDTTFGSDSSEVKGCLSVKEVGTFDEERHSQIVKFNFVVTEAIQKIMKDNQTNTMYINFKASGSLGTGAESSIKFNILKQRIDEIVVRNYIYERLTNGDFDYTKYYENNILRPIGEGLITIDIAPLNGNFDYLEISDITGAEEIVFVQTEGVHGKRILDNVEKSTDQKGIRLQSLSGGGKVYVATMIDANFTNRKHIVQVRAYVDGIEIKSTTLQIDVKMLPEVNIYLVNKDGTVNRNTVENNYVAQNTTVRFKVETKNSDDIEPIVEAKIGSAIQSITNEGNGYYSIALGANAGNKLEIKATTQLTLNNGNIEESSTTQEYGIENYVINNISVTHSTTNVVDGKNITKIYGNLGADVPIEFYFKNVDLTFEDERFEYKADTYDETETDKAKLGIRNFLSTLNSKEVLNYLSFDFSRVELDDDKILAQLADNDSIKLNFTNNKGTSEERTETIASVWFDGTAKTIKVNMSRDFDIDLTLTLPLKTKDNNFVITSNEDATITRKFVYQLDFIEESSFLEPIAVRSEEDFLNMSSGGDYILAKDLNFDVYTPIDVKLNSFDGNGHKITINSFGLFEEANISAGLFKQVYENMVVMNLNVEYKIMRSTPYDLCNNSANVDYVDASFGGITANNSGVITNCKTLGEIYLCASVVEQAIEDDEISFNIAGLVCKNLGTGRITNSVSELQITAKANIAGVVCSNSGKIASTYFNANNGKGRIYAYNNNVTVPYLIQVAGFALNNETDGEISMCYVESGTHVRNGSNIGNISAKDYSSGFVYTNSGSIVDCYADIELIGESSNNDIAGFVYNNTGEVENCYSFVNNGKKTNLISMFAPEKTTGITNCYEIKQDVAGYKNNVEGLTTISSLNRTQKESYPSLMFGNNISAVWTKSPQDLPKLVSTQEKVEFSGEALKDEDKNKEYPEYYYGLKTLNLEVKDILDDLGNIIRKEYKYKTIANNFGDKQNPILIYNLATWNYYLGQTEQSNSYYQNTKYYFRLVNDIDFSSVYENPTSSVCEFNGNLQGNNMDVSNFKIYSSQNLTNIGLFSAVKSLNDAAFDSVVRNIHLLPTSVTASRTQAVGVLTGLAENFNLYNIQVNAQDLTIVGGNAVGGVAGFVRGKFDIDGIYSNVGAYSSRSQQDNNYSIFLSKYQHYDYISSNLSSVYYAGSAFGILDSSIQDNKTLLNWQIHQDMQFVRHVQVELNIILSGETVGALVGLVGKNVVLTNSKSTIASGNFAGSQYSAGLVGENHGVISQAQVELKSADLFKNSPAVSAGAVGLNLNGLIDNVTVYAEILKTNQSIVAGLVGRNLKGYISNVSVDGLFSGYLVGGIVGADYDITTFVNRSISGGTGAIRINRSTLEDLTKTTFINFKENEYFKNMALSKQCVDNFILNSASYYTFKEDTSTKQVNIIAKKVLGLAVGVTDKGDDYDIVYGYNTVNNQLIFNGSYNINGIGAVKSNYTINNKAIWFGLMNIINNYQLPEKFTQNSVVLFAVGAKVSSFDLWLYNTGYTNECFAIVRASGGEDSSQAVMASIVANETNSVVYIKKSTGNFFKMSKDDKYLTNINLSSIDLADLSTMLTDAEDEKTYKFVRDNDNTKLWQIS